MDVPEFFYKIDYPVWFALYTKPNHEKRVYECLRCFDIESFLPLRIITTKNFKEIEVPLFRSYVFLKLIPRTKKFYMAMDLKGSMGYVKFNNIPAIIDEREIEALRKLIENGNKRVFPVYEIKEGKEITLKRGPFANCKIIVKSFDEKRDIIIAWIKEIFAGGALHIKKEDLLKWI